MLLEAWIAVWEWPPPDGFWTGGNIPAVRIRSLRGRRNWQRVEYGPEILFCRGIGSRGAELGAIGFVWVAGFKNLLVSRLMSLQSHFLAAASGPEFIWPPCCEIFRMTSSALVTIRGFLQWHLLHQAYH